MNWREKLWRDFTEAFVKSVLFFVFLMAIGSCMKHVKVMWVP